MKSDYTFNLPIELLYVFLKKLDYRSLANLMLVSSKWIHLIRNFVIDYRLIDHIKRYNISLIERYPPKDKQDIIKNGCSIDVLKWLKDNGCPLDETTFKCAAKNGNLENMIWLKENNCPYDKVWCLRYAKTDEVRQWLEDNL